MQVNQQNNVAFETLIGRQNDILRELADIQRGLFELQQKLQDLLGGGLSFKIDTNFIPEIPPFEVDRTDRVPAVKPIPDDAAPPDVTPAPPQNDIQSNQVSDLPPTAIGQDAVIPLFDELESPCVSSFGTPGFCKPLVRCQFYYADIPEVRKRPCVLGAGQFGVCCPFREKESK